MTMAPLRQRTPPKGKGNRYYETPNGDRYPSVTAILEVLDKPELDNWKVSRERAMLLEAAADLYADLPVTAARMSRMVYIDTLNKRVGKIRAGDRIKNKAGDIGTAAHARIEWQLQQIMGRAVGPEPVTDQASLWAYMAWEDWWKDAGLIPIWMEQIVYSDRFKYAGQADLLARDKDGKLVLIDFKTSKAIYPPTYLQLAAYAQALDEMEHGPIERALALRLPKSSDDTGFEVVEVPNLLDEFGTFVHTLAAWQWWQYHRDLYDAQKENEDRDQG